MKPSLLLLLLAAAAPARADWKRDVCRKACIAPHDAHVIACKTVATKEEKSCLADAERGRRGCEASCDKPAPKKPAKKKAKSALSQR